MKKLLVVLGLMLMIVLIGAICVVLANPDVVTKILGKKEVVTTPTNTVVEDTNTQSPSNEIISDEEESENENETNTTEKSNTLVVGLNSDDDSKEPKEEEIKELLELYSIGINRIKNDENNLESNTILLYIAKSYFDTHNSVSIDIDTKYATTVKNVHKFLSELTSRKFDEKSRIKSYSNIIGYSTKTNSYSIGNDISFLKNEEYSVSDISYEKNDDDTYSGTARIIRKSTNDDNAEFTHYDATFDFSINEDYTYSKYKILNIDVENIDHDVDNTRHFN